MNNLEEPVNKLLIDLWGLPANRNLITHPDSYLRAKTIVREFYLKAFKEGQNSTNASNPMDSIDALVEIKKAKPPGALYDGREIDLLLEKAFAAGQAEGAKDKERLAYLKTLCQFDGADTHCSILRFKWCSFRYSFEDGIDHAIAQKNGK